MFLAGGLAGSVASFAFTPGAGIGASGGVLGLAGYLLIRGDQSGFPKWLRHNLWLMLGGAAVSGIAGYFFIDNASHAGGMLAGMLVALATGSSNSSRDPEASSGSVDEVAWIAMTLLALGGLLTVARLMRWL